MNRLVLSLLPLLLAGAAPLPDPDGPPIAQSRAGPCRMSVYGGPEVFAVIVRGLKPNEQVVTLSRSENERIEGGGTASADGEYLALTSPLVVGKTFGRASFEVIGSRCRIEASYNWREQ